MKKPALPTFKMPAVDLKGLAEDFKTLDPKDPGLWPTAPKWVILAALFIGLLVAAWFVGWSGQLDELDAKRKKEVELKADWLAKKSKAINLDEYRKQLAEIDRSFGDLLKQLPNKAEMDGMIVDVSQAALTRGLKQELFKPGAEAKKEFYASVPISLVLTGGYNELGEFTADIAKLPRIVTLNNIKLAPKDKDKKSSNGNVLTMQATAMTYRYLDESEMAAQKKNKAAAKKKRGRRK
ncbi:MAG: type 4a pilus biogenesis protein PilO [Georgfuchsia sp.]